MLLKKKDLKEELGIVGISTLNNFLTDEKIQGKLLKYIQFQALGIKVFNLEKLKEFYKEYALKQAKKKTDAGRKNMKYYKK